MAIDFNPFSSNYTKAVAAQQQIGGNYQPIERTSSNKTGSFSDHLDNTFGVPNTNSITANGGLTAAKKTTETQPQEKQQNKGLFSTLQGINGELSPETRDEYSGLGQKLYFMA